MPVTRLIHVLFVAACAVLCAVPTARAADRLPTARPAMHFGEVPGKAVGDTIDLMGPGNAFPYRGDFARGIFATLVVKTKVKLDELVKIYKDYYAEDSFTHIVEKNIDLKQVVNTNKCLIHLEKHGDKLLIISCIDNLLKGASGQAVHNMNLMFNLEETVGLKLKPSAF